MPEDIIEMIYEVFDQIKEAENADNQTLVNEKRKELESLRSELANSCVNKKATSLYNNFLSKSAKITG